MQGFRLRLFDTPALLQTSGAEPLLPERLTQLAVVLAARDEWTTRDHVVALLWPALDDESARRNLRKLLFRARQQPWFDGLQARTDALRWHADSDLRDFETACGRQDWERAVTAYGGAFCDGLEHKAAEPFVEWLRFERNRLAASFRIAAAQRLQQLGGDAAQREQVARQWLVFDPLDEDALAAIVEAVTAQGRPGEARRAIEQFGERLTQEVGVAPSARVQALLDDGRSAAPSLTPAEAGLVGRRAELREAEALLLRDECRVLTLTGPGGVGKSRLAKALVGPLEARFAGVHWIGLEDLTGIEQVVPRTAAALGVSLSGPADPLEQLVAALHGRPQQLFVFDNAEHLGESAALVERLTQACATVKLLVTSRARLAVSGEWLLPLGGLATPDARRNRAGVDSRLRRREAVRAACARRRARFRRQARCGGRRCAGASARRYAARDRTRRCVGPCASCCGDSARDRGVDRSARTRWACARSPAQRARELRSFVAASQCARAAVPGAAVGVRGAFHARGGRAGRRRAGCLYWRLSPTSRCCARTTTVASRCTPSCSSASAAT